MWTLDNRKLQVYQWYISVVFVFVKQLAKDKERLQAMMAHLHVKSEPRPALQPVCHFICHLLGLIKPICVVLKIHFKIAGEIFNFFF